MRRRGDLTPWLDEAALDGWAAPKRSSPGGQPRHSELAIEPVLTLRLVFHLALRQAEAFSRSVLRLLGLALSVPDHSMPGRRGQAFAGGSRACWPVLAQSIWCWTARTWNCSPKASGMPRSMAGRAGSGEIAAHVLTEGHADDEAQVPALLGQIEGVIASVTANGAYDGEPSYAAAAARQPASGDQLASLRRQPAPAWQPDGVADRRCDFEMGGRAAHDARRAVLIFAARHPDGAHVARGVPPGLPTSRGPDRLHRRPARPQLARAGPQHLEPACGDAGCATAAERRCWGWQRAHAPSGGQYGPEAVRQGRVAAGEARDGDTPVVAHAAPRRGRRQRPDHGLHAERPERWTRCPKSVPCSTRSQGPRRRSPATAPTTGIASTPTSPSATPKRLSSSRRA